MEQVLNLPYEENINLNTLEQIVQKSLPSYKVKKRKRDTSKMGWLHSLLLLMR